MWVGFPRETGCLVAVAVPDLLEMTEGELDELFRRSEAGEIPNGEGEGTVLLRPGTELSGPAAKLVHFIAWQGKVFDRERGELRNEILPFGLKAVRAKVYKQASWLDGKETIASTTRRRRSPRARRRFASTPAAAPAPDRLKEG
jgi:hypothetical protein